MSDEKCSRCGLPVEMTITFSTPGQPLSKPICRKCLRELPKRVAAMLAEKAKRENAK